jgi:hypothetical protein
LAVGSHHWPGSHAKGRGPTPSGRQTFPVGSHHSPSAQSAELTAGVAIVTAAIDAKAIMAMTTRRRMNILIVDLPLVLSIIEPSPGRRVKITV